MPLGDLDPLEATPLGCAGMLRNTCPLATSQRSIFTTAEPEGLAEPGGAFISNIVYEEVRDRLPFDFDDIGKQRIKNIARLVRVYRVPITQYAAVGAPLPRRDKPSLAVVLPFQNISGDPEQDYFADGIGEEITTAIARLPWPFVIARNSSYTSKGRAVDVRQVAPNSAYANRGRQGRSRDPVHGRVHSLDLRRRARRGYDSRSAPLFAQSEFPFMLG